MKRDSQHANLDVIQTKSSFKDYVRSYEPTEFEIVTAEDRSFSPGSHFLQNHAYRFYRFLGFVCRQEFNNILDIGCFPGTFIRILGDILPETKIAGAGLGLSPEFKESLPAVEFYECNMDPDLYFDQYLSVPKKLPVQDASFDGVTATEIIEHLYNPYTLAREIYRVLKPGGFFYLTTNNYSSLTHIIRMIVGKTPTTLNFSSEPFEERSNYYWRPHVRFYTRDELKKIFHDVGFSEITVNGYWQEEWYENKESNIKRFLKNHLFNKLMPGLYCSCHEVHGRKQGPATP